MTQRIKKNFSWFVLTVSFLLAFSYITVYPHIGAVEASLIPVYDRIQVFQHNFRGKVYVRGAVFKTERKCDSLFTEVILPSDGTVLWSNLPAPYYKESVLSAFGYVEVPIYLLVMNDYKLKVRLKNSCHSLYPTVTTFIIDIKES